MYLMYTDESGDTGPMPPTGASCTRYFCLSGVVVHELRWQETYDKLIDFRHWLKRQYGVYLEEEIHSAALINKPSSVKGVIGTLKKHERLAVIRHFADHLAKMPALSLVSVILDKRDTNYNSPEHVFKQAWYALFQRFENTIRQGNFPGPPNDNERGLVFADQTNEAMLKKHLADMRIRNPLWTRDRNGNRAVSNEPIRLLIDDPICRNSQHSYFIQAADCAVYLLKQYIEPSSYIKMKGANAYYPKRLKPICCTYASRQDPHGLGIVHLN